MVLVALTRPRVGVDRTAAGHVGVEKVQTGLQMT